MKPRFLIYFPFAAFVLLAATQSAISQIPHTMSYQGVLMKSAGTEADDGIYRVTFKLYAAPTGGTPIWTETQSLEISNGLFQAALGSKAPLDLPFDQPYWLAVGIGTDGESSTRMPLTASAYSLHARSVADGSITRRKISEGQVVKSINSMSDDLRFVAGKNVTILQQGDSLIISADFDRRDTRQAVAAVAEGGSLDKSSSAFSADAERLQSSGNPKVIADKHSVEVVIDKDDDSTEETFSVRHNGKSKDGEGAELMRVQENGNVGIGTASPGEMLTVAGTIESTSGGVKFPDGSIQSSAGGDGSSLNSPDGSQTDALVVDNSGDIGIGTVTPTEKLDVAGNIKSSGKVFASAYASNSPLILEAPAGTERMRITDAGNVGIGTTAPPEELSVSGNVAVLNPSGTETVELVGSGLSGRIQVRNSSGVAKVELDADGDSYFTAGNLGIGITNPTQRLEVDGTVSASAYSGPVAVVFEAPAGNERMRVTNTGSVGIGTSTPPEELSVSGNIAVLSTTGAEIVELARASLSGQIQVRNASGVTKVNLEASGNSYFTGGNVGIGATNPSFPLTMGSGAHVTAGGVWTDASSRAYKENIRELTSEEAMAAFQALQPTKFSYKAEKGEEHVGFIAEDVPELVANRDRNGLSPMDIVAVLTKVVQEQQKQIDALRARLDERQ